MLKKRAARLGLVLSLSFRYFYIIIPAMSKLRRVLNVLFCQLVFDLHPQQLCISIRKQQMESLHFLLATLSLMWKKRRFLVSGIFQSLTNIYGDIALRFNREC